MDIQRGDSKQRKHRKHLRNALIGLSALTALGTAAFVLQDAAPRLEADAVWIDSVRRGALEVRVRGMGTLVPETVRWVTSATAGEVRAIHLLPGAEVTADSVILELANPTLAQDLANAKLELAAAEARLANAKANETDQLLEMEFQLAQLEASYASAQLEVKVNESLYAEGLVAERDLLRSQLSEQQWQRQSAILRRRFETRQSQRAQNLAPVTAAVDQQRERVALLEAQVAQLQVRAGLAGVLQRLPVEEGQQVAAGAQLAQVADVRQLKAVIRVPETQAKDVRIGLAAQIDTRNGVASGIVARVSPTVQAGTVDIDVRIDQPLPDGARVDLSVEGSILIDDIANTLFVTRPSFGRENATLAVFKLTSDSTAQRTEVRFGRTSVAQIEIVGGLAEGDRIILSDTSEYADEDRLVLN